MCHYLICPVGKALQFGQVAAGQGILDIGRQHTEEDLLQEFVGAEVAEPGK